MEKELGAEVGRLATTGDAPVTGEPTAGDRQRLATGESATRRVTDRGRLSEGDACKGGVGWTCGGNWLAMGGGGRCSAAKNLSLIHI